MRFLNAYNFDANATHPVLAEVVGELSALGWSLGNPSSVHGAGQAARALIEKARQQVLRLVGGDRARHRLLFTSGASEALNALILKSGRRHLIASAVEHAAVLETARYAEEQGARLTVIAPRPEGGFDPSDFVSACGAEKSLVLVMAANNETGAILPVREIAAAIKKASPATLIICDAVQAAGKIPVSIDSLGVDALVLSGHKFGGLPGVGCIIAKKDLYLEPWLFGGPQEQGYRAGTENVYAIHAMGVAASLAERELESRAGRLKAFSEDLSKRLTALSERVGVQRFSPHHLPNTLSVRLHGVKADDAVVALDLQGIAVSSGSACASGRPAPSHVLLAYGLSESAARETLRVSLPLNCDELQYRNASAVLVACLERMLESGIGVVAAEARSDALGSSAEGVC